MLDEPFEQLRELRATAPELVAVRVDGLLATADEQTYARWAAALALPGVRGFVVGRALLYPADGDVAAAVDSAVALVHSNAKVGAQ